MPFFLILAPFSLPKRLPNRPKIEEKWMQKLDRETSRFRDRFFLDFSWIFDPILYEKAAKTMEGCSFFMFSLLRLQDRFWSILCSFWHRFFFNFGSQNVLKTHPKTCLKNHSIPTRFFIAFWYHLGGKLAIIPPSCRQLGPHVRSSWPLWEHLGPSWLHFGLLLGAALSAEASRDAQGAARTSKTIPRRWFFIDLGPNFAPIFIVFFAFRVFLRLCVPSFSC